jgi:hypothetical protein
MSAPLPLRSLLTRSACPQLRTLAPKFALTGVAAMISEAVTFPIGALPKSSRLRVSRPALLPPALRVWF